MSWGRGAVSQEYFGGGAENRWS